MRRLPQLCLAAPLALCSAACSWLPGLADPELRISPRMYLYQHEGRARMQSVSGGEIVNNPAMDVSRFGQLRRDEDYGGVLMLGDGFSGLEASFQLVDIDDSKTGTLVEDFGRIPRGTVVNSNLEYQEYRFAYIAEVFGRDFEVDEDDTIGVQLGVGGELVHRNGDFETFDPLDLTGATLQRVDMRDDGTPYLRLRTRVSWRAFSLQGDWAVNPDIHFGGNFDGVMNDVEVTARYLIETQDIAVLAGFRWSELPATGTEGDLRYDLDFEVQGYFVGLEVLF